MTNFNDIFKRVGWGAIVVVCLFVGSRVEKMTDSITSLNTNVAVIMTKFDNQVKTQDSLQKTMGDTVDKLVDHERRLIILEVKRR